MAGKSMNGLVVGSFTLIQFGGLSTRNAGWAVKAWLNLAQTGKKPASIPRGCEAAWATIQEETLKLSRISEARRSAGRKGGKAGGKQKGSKTEAGGSKSKQKQAEEKRREYNTPLTGCKRARGGARPCAGETPAPPDHTPEEEKQTWYPNSTPPEGLAEECKDGPLTAEDAWGYATGGMVAAPVTPEQIVKWANNQAKNGWKTKGGRMMGRREALASLRGWLVEDVARRAKDGRGVLGGSVRGVRIEGQSPLAEKVDF